MKDVVLDEITKQLNWKEKIIVKIFTKTFVKVYNVVRINMVNIILN